MTAESKDNVLNKSPIDQFELVSSDSNIKKGIKNISTLKVERLINQQIPATKTDKPNNI